MSTLHIEHPISDFNTWKAASLEACCHGDSDKVSTRPAKCPL
jgi:hypothetical protein